MCGLKLDWKQAVKGREYLYGDKDNWAFAIWDEEVKDMPG
jgi:hypothetical protein